MAGVDDRGWIKLSRGITDNFIWDFERPKYAMAWIDMLLMANYMDKKIMFDGKVETIPRGSFITSMVKLSERWGMNRKTVKTFLDTLVQDGMITYQTTSRRTAICIKNYLSYQGFAGFDDADSGQLTGQQSGQLTGQQSGQLTGQQSGQLTGHNIRKKESNKVKKEKKGEVPGDKRPPAPISADYSKTSFSEPMKAKVNEWLQYKQERREEYQPTGLQSLITQMQNSVNQHGEAAVMALIGDCMASNYRGITFDRLSKQQPIGGKAQQEPIRKEPDVSWMKQYIEQRDRKRTKKVADDP